MQSIKDISERNHRVEMEKAWETSKTRRTIIALMTYIVAAVFMKHIGVEEYMLSALVPTGGYIFSTLSLPVVKTMWIQKKESSFESGFNEVKKRDMSDSESALRGTQKYDS